MSQTFFAPLPVDVSRQAVLGRRFLAFLVDVTIVAVLGWSAVVFILIFGIFTLGLGWLMFHIVPWIPLLYFTAFVGGTGATPGQRLLGIAVRQEASLLPPTMAQALVWTLLLAVSFAFGGLPLLLALVRPHRTVHDLLTGLAVIRRP